jgi:hypothetical protein
VELLDGLRVLRALVLLVDNLHEAHLLHGPCVT